MSEARKLFLTNNCCCCFSIETGGYIIGCFGVLTSFIMTSFYFNIVKEFWNATCEEFEKDIFFGKIFSNFDNCDTAKTVSMTYVTFVIIMLIIDIIASGLLIIAIKMRNHKLFIPVIIAEIVALIFFVVRRLITFTKLGFASAIGFGAICIYVIIIIASLYFKFKDERDGKPRYSPAKESATQSA